MGTVVRLAARRQPAPKRTTTDCECEVVIFPGVRIERHEVDLGARLTDSVGRTDFDLLGMGRPAG